jgi:F-type H+-transporting ATPase subunit b
MLLSLNPLVAPDPGLFIWSAVTFILFCVILRAFAWKPIVNALEDRERSIEDALTKAELAKEEMAKLTSENEQLLKDARIERDHILKSAKELKDQIVSEARTSAQVDGAKLIEKAKQEIEAQKTAAMQQVKNQVSALSLEIAEKILRKQFEDQDKQQELVNDLLKDVKLN